MMRAYRFLGVCIVLAIMAGGAAEAANRSYRIRKLMCQMDDSCPSASGGSGQLGLAVAQGNPAAMDIAGGSSPGENVVFAITNTGGQTTGALTVSLTGDTGNFSKTADTCNGQVLAASANCSITIRPVATADGSYTGTLQVSATPGGTVSRALSGTASGFVVDPGTVMPDGMVYVGLSPDGNLPMYVTRCDAGMTWDGAACTGVRATLTWGAFGIATGIIDVNTGKANTSALIMFGGTDAAQNCYDLNLHGHTDWYLPAKDELNVIYQASVAAGGTFRASFATSGQSSYWPSTEPDGMNTTVAWYQNFADGYQDLDGKGDVLSVRCARTDSDIVAPTGSGLSPADGAVDVAVDANLVITFSENVQIGIGDIEIRRSSDGQVLEAINVADAGKVGISGNQVTINPDATFANGEDYYVTVAPGAFTDMSDNPFAGISGSTAWNFTTVSAPVDPCAGSPVAGDVCADDTVYVGLSPDGNVPMYVTRCDAGMTWDGSACTGTRSAITWNNGTTNWTVTGITNVNTGEANTTALSVLSDGGQPYQAARYCDNLDMHGKTDWYLPAKAELNVIYFASVTAGGTFRSSFDLSGSSPSGYYWSSSEYSFFYAWNLMLSDGSQLYAPTRDHVRSVRCSRTDSAELGMTVPQGDPAAMDIAGGSSPGANVVFTITNTGEAASGTMAVSLTGDTGNFSKTADTCNGQTLAVSASCSITIQPIATDNGSYTGTLEVSGTPGGTVSRALSGTASGFVLACGGSPVPGCLAADGTVYAGLSPDGNVPMYVARCDAGMSWDGSACTGTRSGIIWGTYGTATSMLNVTTGELNTTTLATSYGDTAAAKYCYNLDLHGKTDWYLPAKDELNVLYINRMSIGGFDITASSKYYTSTEADGWFAKWQSLNWGGQGEQLKNGAISVRCARKDSAATLGMTVPQGDPAAMDITGGSSPGSNVVFTITNGGEAASGTLAVSLTGDTGNFSKTADTCNGGALAASASCSITIQPIATDNGGYTGMLQVSGTPGGTVSRALSGTASGFMVACGGSPVPGCVAADGTVYAGLSPDGNVPMYVTRCDAGMTWDGSACSGTRSAITWNNGTGNWTVTGITNVNTGEANTAALAVLLDAGQPYQAARYCDNLDMQGKTDWYLPALAELNVIYLASVAAGGTFRASFDLSGLYPPGWYWSSSEYENTTAFDQRLSDGTQGANLKYGYGGDIGLSIRCSRKDSAELGMTVPQGDPAAMDITGGSSPGENVVFAITNTGEAASGTMADSLTGDTGNFSKTADTCNGQALAASASCSITIQPIATENGGYTGTLSVSASPGGTVSRGLSGTASGFLLPTSLSIDPTSPVMDVAGATQGTTAYSSAVTFTVSNCAGCQTPDVVNASLSGANFEFTGTDNCTGHTLAGGESCTLQVRAVATEDGTYTGTLSVASGSPVSIADASLSGTASGFVAASGYYSSLSAAQTDGLVMYLPFNEGSGGSVIDRGSANNGASYSTNGGLWVNTAVDAQYGLLMSMPSTVGSYIRPMPDPTATSKTYTMMIIAPGRSLFSSTTTLFHANKQYNSACYTLTDADLSYNAGNYDAFMARNCNTGAHVIVPAATAENADGVVIAFFSHDGTTYRTQIGTSAEATTASLSVGTDVNSLIIKGAWNSGTIMTGWYNSAIYSWAMWNRVLSKAEKDTIAQNLRGELVSGY